MMGSVAQPRRLLQVRDAGIALLPHHAPERAPRSRLLLLRSCHAANCWHVTLPRQTWSPHENGLTTLFL